MIQESYVTFEQAKALKELGFPQNWNNGTLVYCTKGEFKGTINAFNIYAPKRDIDSISAPTLSIVQKWLREETNLYIIVHCPFKKNHWEYDIDASYNKNEIQTISNEYNFKTYEQALSAGIDRCIELLLKEK